MIVQLGLCQTGSEISKTGFLTSRLKSCFKRCGHAAQNAQTIITDKVTFNSVYILNVHMYTSDSCIAIQTVMIINDIKP